MLSRELRRNRNVRKPRRTSFRWPRPRFAHTSCVCVHQSATVDRCLPQVFQINNSDSPSPWDCGWQCACVCARFCVNTWVNSTHSDKGKHRRYAVRSLSHRAAVSVINAADGALSGAWTWTWHQTSSSHSSLYTHTSHDAVWVVKYWPTLSADV